MLWGIVVAVGVAITSMTIFAARLTRRPDHVSPDDFVPQTDPDDPWAAYAPRPMDELDRPRPRVWPVAAALVGLLLIGGGIAGARQEAISSTDRAGTIVDEIQPSELDIDVAPAASQEPDEEAETVEAAPDPTPAPQVTAAPVASGTGPPSIDATASCASGTVKLEFSITAGAANLSWFTLHLDGDSVRGGPIGGTSFSSSYSQAAGAGDHVFELVADDKDDGQSREFFRVSCPA